MGPMGRVGKHVNLVLMNTTEGVQQLASDSGSMGYSYRNGAQKKRDGLYAWRSALILEAAANRVDILNNYLR